MYHNQRLLIVCLLGFSLFAGSCGPNDKKKTGHYEEGNALLINGDLAEAEQAFSKAIAMDNTYADAYVKLGVAQMRQGHLKAAFASFARAAELNPKNIAVQLRLATFYILNRDFSRAFTVLDTVLAQDPNNIEALFLKGSLLAQKKSLEEANVFFEKIISKDPSQVRAYLALVKTNAVLGKNEETIPLLHLAIANNPHSLDLKLALVDRYLVLDKVVDAKGVLLDALQHDPGNPELEGILGTFYFRIGEMPMAESAYKEAVRLSPAQLKPLMNLGRFYALTGDEEHAAETYLHAVEMASGNVQVLDAVSRFYAHNGKADQAEKFVLMALDANPTFLPSRILQTELALQKGDFERTLHLSQALLDEGRKLPKIYYLQGMALFASGETDKAEKTLLQAVDGWPGHVGARLGLARLYFETGRYTVASAQAHDIIRLSPRNLEARVILGSIATRLGDSDRAEAYYREALDLNPNYAPAANNLAYLLVKRGDNLEEALTFAKVAQKWMPEDAGIQDTLGWISFQRGEVDTAVALMERSVAGDPKNPIFFYHLGMGYLTQGKRAAARKAFTDALELSGEFEGAVDARAQLVEMGEETTDAGSEENRGE